MDYSSFTELIIENPIKLVSGVEEYKEDLS